MLKKLRENINIWRVLLAGLAVIGSLSLVGYILNEIDSEAAVMLLTVSVLGFVALLVVMTIVRRAARRRRAESILQTIKQIVAMSLPLAPTILSESAIHRGKTRDALRIIQERLVDGDPLAIALAATREFPRRLIEQVSALERAGLLETHLRYVGRNREDSEQAVGNRFYCNYAVFFGVLFCAILTLLLVAVVPKFQDILRSFHSGMPPALRLLLEIVNQDYGWLWLLLLIALISVAFTRLGGFITDELLWRTPLLGERARSQAFSRLFRFIAAAIEAGRPMDETLADAAALVDPAPLRRRIARWALGVQAGGGLAAAGRAAGMPGVVTGMLGAIPAADSSLVTAEFLAAYYDARFSRLDDVAQGLVVPVIVLAMGAGTLLLGLSVFEPMARLIAILSPSGGGF